MEFELEYVENGKYFNILNKWEILVWNDYLIMIENLKG